MKSESLAITLLLAAGLIFAFAGPVQAQESSGSVRAFELSAAYSYVRANSSGSAGNFSVNGGSATAAYNFTGRFAIVADVGGYHFSGLPNGVNSTMYSYLFGPRVTLRNRGRLIPFAQALFGGGRLNASSQGVEAGENGFAFAFGGGLDIPLHRGFAIRAVEADYFATRFPHADGSAAMQNNVRISTGLVIRFGGSR